MEADGGLVQLLSEEYLAQFLPCRPTTSGSWTASPPPLPLAAAAAATVYRGPIYGCNGWLGLVLLLLLLLLLEVALDALESIVAAGTGGKGLWNQQPSSCSFGYLCLLVCSDLHVKIDSTWTRFNRVERKLQSVPSLPGWGALQSVSELQALSNEKSINLVVQLSIPGCQI